MINKEIGGYLELESFNGEEYYPGLHKLNLGRTALIWLIQKLGCRRIFMPGYICDTVPAAAGMTDAEILFYGLNEDLEPVFGEEEPRGEGDCLYLVNFYGQLKADRIRPWKDRGFQVIVDNAQGFYDAPVDGVHTIYTCRKFFGLTDGAYVATDLPEDRDLAQDHSHERMQHVLGRREIDAGTYYRRMLEVAEEFRAMPPMRMSKVTENLLRGIDYEQVRERRRKNYETLRDLLPSDNPFTGYMPEAPFAYPYYHKDGVRLRKALAARKIFVPTNWSYLIEAFEEGTHEHDWSADILPLPIDQRYGEEEMRCIAEAIRTDNI